MRSFLLQMKFKECNQKNTVQIYLLQKKKERKKERRNKNKKKKENKRKNQKKEAGRREKRNVKNLTKSQSNLLHMVLPAPIPFCLVSYSTFYWSLESKDSVCGDEGKNEFSVPESL